MIASASLLGAAPSFGQRSGREARKEASRARKQVAKRAKRMQKEARRREKKLLKKATDRNKDAARRNARLVKDRKAQQRDVGSRTTSNQSPFEPLKEGTAGGDEEIRVKQRGLEGPAEEPQR